VRLFLIRHPQPDVATGICYGSSELALRKPWSADAAMRLLPSDARFASSPLRRCTEFAAALSSEVRIDPRLAEMDFGTWEMQAWNDIPREQLDAWAADLPGFSGHGGESVAQLRVRVRQALSDLPGTDCVWITHAGVMRLAFAELLDLPQDEWLKLHFDYASVSAIEITAGAARLLFRNRF
jgi:alpha-ribazole phosphatase